MTKVQLSHVLKGLEIQIDISHKLISKVKFLKLPRIQLETIAELAFFKLFIAWENFLEESFIRYVTGAESPSGFKPKRNVITSNMEIAKNLILAGREYIKWNQAGEVISRADCYFLDGEPYKNALYGTTKDLNDMNTIRNRIAHGSAISKIKFKDFVREIFGHGIRGMSPGRFLLTIKDPNLQKTFLDYYVEIIKIASTIIVE